MDDNIEMSEKEVQFYNALREYIVCILILLALYALSFLIISRYRLRKENDDLFGADDEDYIIYSIANAICTFSLCVSIGALLLLPFSILGNEIHHMYPNSWYFKWLSGSLIYNLWNYVFLLSNICIFMLLPFAYFFIESQGFSVMRKGVKSRVYEAVILCILSLLCMAVIVFVFSLLLLSNSPLRLLAFTEVWHYDLPFLYSYVSIVGVGALLAVAPYGFVKIFTVVNDSLSKTSSETRFELRSPLMTQSLIEARVPYSSLPKYMNADLSLQNRSLSTNNLHNPKQTFYCYNNNNLTDEGCAMPLLMPLPFKTGVQLRKAPTCVNDVFKSSCEDILTSESYFVRHNNITTHNGSNGYLSTSMKDPNDPTQDATTNKLMSNKKLIEFSKKSSRCFNAIKYPIYMLVCLSLTATSLLLVLSNIVRLVFNMQRWSQPATLYANLVESIIPSLNNKDSTQDRVTFQYGDSSLSILGSLGAFVHILVLMWFTASSLIGLYSIPLIRNIRPRLKATTMTHIIVNCAIVLVLSSAVPVCTNTLGLSPFDLLGAYGQLGWLDNVRLVFAYNVVFAASTTLCLVTKFTAAARQQLRLRLTELSTIIGRRARHSSSVHDKSE